MIPIIILSSSTGTLGLMNTNSAQVVVVSKYDKTMMKYNRLYTVGTD